MTITVPGIFVVGLLSLHQDSASAWVTFPTFRPFISSASHLFSTGSDGVSSISLKNVVNHEEEGAKMAKSITAWLDAEWMPQDVHSRMAESAKKSYINCRETGEDDLMAIMTTIADDLTANWHQYDGDAFINAWDISNYVSDYLVKLSGSEGCECSSKIY